MRRSFRLPMVLTAVLVTCATGAVALAQAAATPPAAPAAAPSAPALSPAAARAQAAALQAEFDRVDTNDDGRVSSSEHEVYARALFDQLDANTDYNLTVDEIMAAPDKFFRHVYAGVGGLFGGTTLTPPQVIERLDANQDGVVSRDEHADAARAKFRLMDSNNNGELSPGEFAAGG